MFRATNMFLTYATAALVKIPGLQIIGTAKEKGGVVSFIMKGFRTEWIGDYLNRKGIAVRGGQHCAQPILRRFGQKSTVRDLRALQHLRGSGCTGRGLVGSQARTQSGTRLTEN